VIAIIAILAALLLPALSATKECAQMAKCLSNHRQIGISFQLYRDDHQTKFPPILSPYGSSSFQFGGGDPNRQIAGNLLAATNRPLWPYAQSRELFRCPADCGAANAIWTGPFKSWFELFGTSYKYNENPSVEQTRRPQIVDPPPSRTWVFIDEHPLSIDDGVFLIARSTGDGCYWSSYRGDQHKNGANLSFADGHVEHYRWRCRRKFAQYSYNWTPTINAGDCADLNKLYEGLPHSP
jgi:prepilin-type processing-associated H-X9-DG protein